MVEFVSQLISKSNQLRRKLSVQVVGSSIIGMISHKKSLITNFGHKHKIKNFIKKFDIFHRKF